MKRNKKVELPWEGNIFAQAWDRWKRYKYDTFKFKYKTVQSEQTALNLLYTMSWADPMIAMKIIDQSIGNQWRGLFKLQGDGTSKTKPRTGAANRQYDSINGVGQDLFARLTGLDGVGDHDSGNP